MKITSNMSNYLIDVNILGNKVTSMKTRSNMAKIVNKLHIFRNCRKSQVISMKITSNMSNNLIDTNVLGNWVTSMTTRSNMAKIVNNLHIFRNFRKSGHQYENYIRYVK